MQLIRLPGDSSSPTPSLASRVILVTGASGGLGRATALACARSGAVVVLLGRNVRALEAVYDEIRALGAPEPALYPLNLEGATPDDYDALAATILRECGRLDGIVHAAARFDGLIASEHLPADRWLTAIHVNLNAPWALTRACLPLLRQAPDAAVIFTLDDPARIGRTLWGAYGAAKFALDGVLRGLADEYDGTSVRMHGLLPPPMRTKLRANAYFAENPGTIETPERTAEACVWLLGTAWTVGRGRVLDLRLGTAEEAPA